MRGLFVAVFVAGACVLATAARGAPLPPVADFSGVHLGLDTAYGFGAAGDWCFCTFLPPALDAAGGSGGLVIGGEAGYGVRIGPVVIEADARLSYSNVGFAETCGPALRCDGELSWLGEADVTAGVVVFDDILVAASAGYAAGSVRARVFDVAGTLDEETSRHDGHVYSARIEQGMSGGWRFGLEYRYYDMSGEANLSPGTPAPTQVDVDWHAHIGGLTIRYEL